MLFVLKWLQAWHFPHIAASTSDKMKGPKTGPPGGTTFDPKRVHFWVPSEMYLLWARVQNWALSILNLVPPWWLVWRPYSNTLLRRVVGIRPQTSASHIIATTSWQPGPRTREAPTVSPKSLLISGANEPSGHGEVLLLKWQKDQQMWKHVPVHCQILRGAKAQLFQGRKQNLYSFLFTLPKVAPLHPGFSLSIF